MAFPRFSFFIFLWVLICGLSACRERKPVVVTRAYYYWRNSTYVSRAEIDFLRTHQVRKVYAKCLDIDWDETYHAHPLTITRVQEIARAFKYYPDDTVNASVVPVVFVTNKTFQHTDSAEIPLLATRVLRKCIPEFDAPADTNPLYRDWYPAPTEIQFDCDWSASTKDRYFYFLQCIRKQLGKRPIIVSATIRLHQFKYPERTGVPPVHRGMLMVYNISKLTAYTQVNSIYDHKNAQAYFTRNKLYGLPLDIALPAYSWGIIFRQGKFMQIENGLTDAMLRNKAFLRQTRTNLYSVTTDTVYRELYLRPGDEIKIEQVDAALLMQTATLAGKAINTDSFAVSLFELSEQEINNYRYETIEQVYNSFGR